MATLFHTETDCNETPPQEIGNPDVSTSSDAGMVSLHIVQSNEGALEVEGVLADAANVKHPADGTIDGDVADFIAELETDSPVDVLSPSPVESTHHEAELDAVKENLANTFSGFIKKEKDDSNCDLSAVTECYSAVTEKMCNLTAEELRHGDASYTPASGFALRKYTKPEISADEVLIKVYATTISTRDCLERIRRGNDESLSYDAWVPGHEIVGRVEQAGSNTEHMLNRRVAALLSHGGGCSRYVRVHSKDLIDLPEIDFSASSQDMVHLLSTYMPAYQCLERALLDIDQSFCGATDLMCFDSDDFSPRGPLSGSCVLINGAGSPVGLAFVELAKKAGATVYALSHSSHKQTIHELGVKEWYPLFRKQEWKTEWSGRMDVIVDTVGDYGNYQNFYEVMASGGRFVRINTTSCEKKFVPMGEYTEDYFSVWEDLKGSSVHRMAIDYDIFDCYRKGKMAFTNDLIYLYSLFRSGRILPRVFSSTSLDKLGEEWQKVMGGGATGIVIVSP
mmetsp:Transcript_21174/g.33265  ORF Transcript_21174/g.33265 Transcript_21174/m.33265 type:complete len:508 (+) Transcript_21174:166-1689(+)